MNPKARGEKGQRIVIGELAKWDIDVAIPLTDNLPFDFIVIKNGKLYKIQVKSSNQKQKETKGSIPFKLTTSNWYNGTTKKYFKSDIDLMFLCDYNKVYILEPKHFENRRSFSIRQEKSRNCQNENINLSSDFEISEKRIKEVFI